MTKSAFEQKLDKALGLETPAPRAYTEMYQRVEQAAGWLENQLKGRGHSVKVVIEPGHLLNVGQQFNVVVLIPTLNNFRDVLFRAYIPAAGKPVTLDLTGDAPVTCASPQVLERRILDFFALDAIRGRLRALRDLAAHKAG